ncbi:MAG TPA: sulfotransferase [Solirubrobacteraceae bacterium]|nr:sulfotransferase [Solirubrobacteraceae bacterium]
MSPDPSGAAPRRVPDFFIVGHQKCGTTALYEMLKRHPQIFMPEVKEPRYFVPELLRPDRVLSTLDGYLALFADAPPGQLAGEASPQYIRSPTAAQAIAQMQPQARIVAVLREPASFLRSFHLQMVHSDIEPERDLRKALALVEERRQGRRLPRGCISAEPLMYFDHVRYVEQLERFHTAFSRERVLVLVYEDLRRDNRAAVRQILEFLDVDPGVAVEPVRTNPNRAVRSQALRRLADSARTARMHPEHATALGKLVNALTPSALHSEGFRARWRDVVYKTPPPPDPGLVRELRIRFRPEVEALSAYLGRDLVADWGYDRLD